MPQTLDVRPAVRPAAALRSEARLVRDARGGDDRAFEELYSRYGQRIFAFILSRVHDHGRAEDIAQEVFMSALRQLRTTGQEIVLQPWLYTIAKNACIDEFRRGARGTAVPVGSDEDLSVGRGLMLSLVPTPDDAIESKQRLDDLRGAFGGLSDSHRQLLVMREFEGLSYDEIGERLGMNRQMVESGLFRARRKLGSEYDDLASGRRCEQMVDAIGAGMFATSKGIGVKERRRTIRHLSHCQNCRHHAMMANVDHSLLKPRSIADKLAALLPFGFWRKLWPHGHGGAGTAAGGKAAGALGGAAQVAAPAAAGSSISMGTAAVAAAVVAIAGAGGGLALAQHHSSHAAKPVPSHVSHAPASGAAVRGSGHAAPATISSGAVHAGHGATGGLTASKLSAKKIAGAKATGGGADAGHNPTRRGHGGSGGGKTTGGGGGAGGGGNSPGAGNNGGGSGNGGGNGGGGSTGGGGSGGQSGNNVGKTVGQTGKTVGGTVSQTGNTVGGVVSQTGNTVGGTISQTGNTVGGTVSQTGNTVGGTVSQTGNTVGGVVSQTGNTVGGVVGTVAPGVGSTVSQTGNAVGGTVSQTGNAVGGTISQTGNAVGGTVSQTGNALGGVVGGVLGGL